MAGRVDAPGGNRREPKADEVSRGSPERTLRTAIVAPPSPTDPDTRALEPHPLATPNNPYNLRHVAHPPLLRPLARHPLANTLSTWATQAQPHSRGRAMRTETLHMTLAFLGSVEKEIADELIDATPATACNPAPSPSTATACSPALVSSGPAPRRLGFAPGQP
ncbi:2'-5' RNA ligase family protein [Achromobacter xylosoxidans]